MPGRNTDANAYKRWCSSGTPWKSQSTIFARLPASWGLLGVRTFMFQEGNDPVAENAYREIARLSHGAYCRFDAGSAHQLGELLRAVAAYAAGGIKALADLSAKRSSAAHIYWPS